MIVFVIANSVRLVSLLLNAIIVFLINRKSNSCYLLIINEVPNIIIIIHIHGHIWGDSLSYY